MCEVLCQFSENNSIMKEHLTFRKFTVYWRNIDINKYFKWSELYTHSATNMKKDNTFEKTVS